jgi:cadmium resistance protein CadD (predicted permease)
MTPLTPEEARDQLATADTLATTSGTDARIGAFTTAGVGVLVALMLAMSKAFAGTNTVVFLIGVVVYVLAIGALMIWHGRRFRVANRGWSRRYRASLGVTMTTYTIGIVWATSGSPSWALFAPYCVAVALPMVVVASRMARR